MRMRASRILNLLNCETKRSLAFHFIFSVYFAFANAIIELRFWCDRRAMTNAFALAAIYHLPSWTATFISRRALAPGYCRTNRS